MGLGFTMSLVIISSIREILGAGTWFGAQVLGASFQPATMFAQAPGGFIVFGFYIAAANLIVGYFEKRKGAKA